MKTFDKPRPQHADVHDTLSAAARVAQSLRLRAQNLAQEQSRRMCRNSYSRPAIVERIQKAIEVLIFKRAVSSTATSDENLDGFLDALDNPRPRVACCGTFVATCSCARFLSAKAAAIGRPAPRREGVVNVGMLRPRLVERLHHPRPRKTSFVMARSTSPPSCRWADS